MEIQQQNEDELAPWRDDDQLPRNIIIEFQNTKKQFSKSPTNKHIQSPLSVNLQRFLERRHRATLKLAERKEQDSLSRSESKRIQVTTLEPENTYMNETMRLKEMFPSYSLKKEREATFYKPHRYHSIHSGQEDNFRISFLRRSIQPHRSNHSNLIKNLTCKKITHNLIPSPSRLSQSQSAADKPILIEAEPIENHRFAVALKSTNNKSKYERIMEMIEKKEKEKSLQRSKTEPDQKLLENCLKTKKECFLNLPKIQFIELCK